ncbi:hypothetical protein ACCO45_000123 [Purpureocillium lilacinum]|uniref:Uncharacterized protein n=1 Tax=Purpureocillium lilacinum TaxID=33203 RepID=A0ACC4E5U9_PURLI
METLPDPSQYTLTGDDDFGSGASTPTIVPDAESVLELPTEQSPVVVVTETPGPLDREEKPDFIKKPAPSDPAAEPISEKPLLSEPPDGGLTAWLQVLAGHLIVFNTWGYIISFGIFQPYYASKLNTAPSAIAWIGSVQICLIFLVGAVSGRAFDAGYYRHALLLGSAMQLIGILATSFARTYLQLFLAQGLCQGSAAASSLRRLLRTCRRTLRGSAAWRFPRRGVVAGRAAWCFRSWRSSSCLGLGFTGRSAPWASSCSSRRS